MSNMNSVETVQRTTWYDHDLQQLMIIDQTLLPHRLLVVPVDSLQGACDAISTMQVRGAPLIGIMAAFGLHFALRDRSVSLSEACDRLLATRPTAINLHWALQRARSHIESIAEPSMQAKAALTLAQQMLAEDAAACSAIGDHGLALLQACWQSRQANGARRLNILTHCNAGWLATAQWGTALAPVYKAHLQGIPVHVWVDETRPRSQGASLTVWELRQSGVPHTLIVDNAGGHLMQHGEVDICVVGSDRTTAAGDVCNKVGTYLKALAAADNGVPFYVALPVSTIDFSLHDGVRDIPIEERHPDEVCLVQGLDANGELTKVRVTPEGTEACNPGFDVTPARFVTGLITEKGVVPATPEGVASLKP